MLNKFLLLVVSLAVAFAGFALWRSDGVQDAITESVSRSGVVIEHSEYPKTVYWGDTHLHTSNSPDAFGFGVRLDPEQALRFARGESVVSTLGQSAQLERPLDFLVISDHSDGLGFSRMIHDAPRFMLPNDQLKRWHDMFRGGPETSQHATAEMIDLGRDMQAAGQLIDPERQARRMESIWKRSIRIVEKFNEPGVFSAFLGYEYTSQPDGNNLHRVVMYRDGFEKGKRVAPFTAMTDPRPEGLWQWMDNYEELTGGRVLAIPHNSNVSNGLMFAFEDSNGELIDADYAARRAYREPVVEVTQIKGDSESHPFLSPNDELAGFGTLGWQDGNIDMSIPKTNDMLAGEYVREALKRGLAIEQRVGVNPYAFGMIGSTDSHTSLATGDEDNFFGKHTGNEPDGSRDRVNVPMNLGTRGGRMNWHYLAGGYAAAWATANTREAIFDAFERREVYATTGPRMTVRFFASWEFGATDLSGDWVANAYAKGVPMGGQLDSASEAAPSFIVAASKDPLGANLDRIQIVKGWVDDTGESRERVYDVVWSSDDVRQPANGKLPAVGNTVDLATASYSNDIGEPELATVWTDLDFDPSLAAFYYVRVLEIPTPRWVVYDAVRYGIDISPAMEPIVQERAYTSPIWYSPE